MAFDNNVETEQNIAKINGVKKIYFSTGTAYIIDANDDLWAWGDNSYNKLGQGNSYLVTEPTKILEGRTEGESNVKAKNVWAGATNTFVLDTNNRLWACGANTDGTLGQGNNNTYYNFVEVKIEGLDYNTIKEIDLGIGKQNNSAILKTTNNRIFKSGYNGYGLLGVGAGDKNRNYNTFIEITDYNDIWKNNKNVINGIIDSFVLTNEGILYGSGYNGNGNLGIGYKSTSSNYQFVEISRNVKDIATKSNGIMILKDDGSIYVNDTQGKLVKIEGIQDVNAKLASRTAIISNGKYYGINNNKAYLKYPSYKLDTELIYMGQMEGFISNEKIYIEGFPDVTIPTEKSIYKLKNIFTGAQFVQSGGNNINIVDDEGNIYEGINNKNTDVNNIKQLISSNTAKYALSNDGKLYAKGTAYMWGDEIYKSDYTVYLRQQITKYTGLEELRM